MGVKALSSGRGPAALLEPIAGLLASGRVLSEVGEVFPLAQASAAQDFSQVGHGRGHAVNKVR